jgi:condensin-2 complex subunit D3
MQFQDSIRRLLRDSHDADYSLAFDSETNHLSENMIRHLQGQMKFSSGYTNDEASNDSDDEGNKDETGFLKTRFTGGESKTAEYLADAPNLRSVLGNLSLDEISKFADLLTTGMTDRLDSEAFLPATQDEAANSAAMDGPAAQKVPRHALTTAQLYVQLLQRPGGWGAGFVQASSLTALVALLKRWRVEIQDIVSIKTSDKNKDKSSDTGRDRQKTRSRGGKVHFGASSDEEPEDDEVMMVESDDESENETPSTMTPTELLSLGLKLCLEVARLPLQCEFLTWSSECREAVIEGVSFILGTSAALSVPSKRSVIDGDIMALAETTMSQAKESLIECLLMPGNLDEDGDDASTGKLSRLHETLVCICRGLYQLLTWKEVLPFGETGRQTASQAASSVLEKMIEGLSGSLTIYQSFRSPSKVINRRSSIVGGMMSPRSKTPLNTNSTPNPKRLSVSGTSGKESIPMTSPKLKSAAKRAIATTTAKSKSRPIFSALVGLLQKLITDVAMEKAAIRNSTVPIVHKCISNLRSRERRHFLQFLIQACHSRVAVHRLIACEIIGKVLAQPWLWTEHSGQEIKSPSDSVSSQKSLSPLVIASESDMPSALFGALQGRLSDRIPTVRATSISSLSSLLKQVREFQATSPAKSVSSLGLSEILNTEVDELLEILRVRASADTRATVRRYAVLALGEVFLWSFSELTEYDLALFRDRCQDSSTMTRRAAAESLTALVESKEFSHFDEAIKHTWISAVLPLCLATEGTNVNPCLEFVQRLIIVPLLSDDAEADENPEIKRAWSLLSKIGDGSGRQGASKNESEALKAAIVNFLESTTEPGRVKADLMRTICHVAKSTLRYSDEFDPGLDARRAGVWCIFDAFVRSFKDNSALLQFFNRKSVNVDFLATAWKDLLSFPAISNQKTTSSQHLRSCVRKALFVMASSSRALEPSAVRATKKSLHRMLCDFDMPEDIISSSISALSAMTLALVPLGNVEDAKADCKSWVSQIFDSCSNKLSDTIGSHASPDELIRVSRALYVVGECSLVGFNASEDNTTTKKEIEFMSAKDFQKKGLTGIYVKPPAELVQMVMSFLSEDLAGCSSVRLPENVRGFAFLSLGKICLRDIQLAKQTLTVFARELHENMSQGSSVIQCNVLLIMGDLCVKYTSLADRYLPVMAACLQSGASDIGSSLFESSANNGFEVVRKTAVILLSSLIMQDYIKWRGLLFHRFLVASSDEDETVAELAENTLSGPLLIKSPKLFFNNFVESFFVLNRCVAHPMYVAAASTGDGGSGIAVGFDGIDLSGGTGRIRRLKMYELMLSKMSDDEKISVTAKIAKEVLKGALVEGSDLFKACAETSGEKISSAYNVLSDALTILRGENIRVGKKHSNDSEDIEDPSMDVTSKKFVEAKSRLMSKISRKQMIEIIVPILCNLKALLQKNCSPLLKDLMAYLVDVYCTCKKEVQEVLMNDPTLLQEIEYDARQQKKEQRPLMPLMTPVQ